MTSTLSPDLSHRPATPRSAPSVLPGTFEQPTRFEILRIIAEGGMGRVYEAIQRGAEGFRKRVAIKVIGGNPLPEERDRFVAEAKLAANLIHYHIVQIYQLGLAPDSSIFIVMELIEGCTLKAFMRRQVERGPLGISVGTFSKPFGLPGLRIGWLVADEAIVSACWAMRDYISLSPGKLNDALAMHALRNRSQITSRTQGIVRENLATANAWFDEWGEVVGWTPPRGGLLALMNYRFDVPSAALADRLAGDYSVMLAPGSAFGFEHHLRIGIGQRPDLFKTGLDRTGECLGTLMREGVGLRNE